MVSRTVMNEQQADTLMAYLRNAPMPFTVTVNPGKLRSMGGGRLNSIGQQESFGIRLSRNT